jgi:hypothetical protein
MATTMMNRATAWWSDASMLQLSVAYALIARDQRE